MRNTGRQVLELPSNSSAEQGYSSARYEACFFYPDEVMGGLGEDEWALHPDTLRQAVENDLEQGLIPFFLKATVGTTSSCAVDPLPRLGEITQHFDMW